MALMSVLCIFSLQLLVARALMCFYCVNGRHEHDCNWKTVTCEIDQEMCYTQIINSGYGVQITKSCYQKHACETLASQNNFNCPRECSLCCDGNKCNNRFKECRCNLVSLSTLKSTTTTVAKTKKYKTTPKRTFVKTTPTKSTTTSLPTLKDEPSSCEDASFIPIPETSEFVACDDLRVNDFTTCEVTTPKLATENRNDQFYHLSMKDSNSTKTSYFQCQADILTSTALNDYSGVNAEGEALTLFCINVTSQKEAENTISSLNPGIKKKNKSPKSQAKRSYFDCVIDDMFLMSQYSEDDTYQLPLYENNNALTYGTNAVEIYKVCGDRFAQVTCYVTSDVSTTQDTAKFLDTTNSTIAIEVTKSTLAITNATFTSGKQSLVYSTVETNVSATSEKLVVLKSASIPTWSISVIAIVAICAVAVVVGLILRQCGKKGFYRVHKKKVTPEHRVQA